MPNWGFLLLRLALGASVCAAMTWGGWKLGGLKYALVAFVLSTPAIAVAIARPLVELIHEGFTWTSRQPLKKWEGNYYEFGGVQVRVVEDEGELWFAADDVIRATGVPVVGGTLLETRELAEWGFAALSIDGVEKVLGRHRSHESGRFILWARREVVTPWQRKRS
jgi:hypothetical protein